MILSFFIDPISDLIANIFLFWDKSDTERVKMIQRAQNQVLDCHDDVLVDSTKKHLLFCTSKGLYLVSKTNTWKSQLTDKEIALYESKGSRAFMRIEHSRKRKATS